MRLFLVVNIRRWRHSPGRVALSVSAVAIGATMLLAVLSLYTSLAQSVNDVIGSLSGTADLEISSVSDAGLPADLVPVVAKEAGVKSAVPLVRLPVLVGGQETLLVGYDKRGAALGRDALQREPPVYDSEIGPGVFLGEDIATKAGLGSGDPVEVRSSTGVRNAVVVGIVQASAVRRLNQGKFALAPLPAAQKLAGLDDRYSTILVVAQPGVDAGALQKRLDAAVGGRAVVADPRLRADQIAATTRPLTQGALFLALLVLFVSTFVVFNTMSMAAQDRRRELAILRAVGGSRAQLLRAFLMEAAVLGLVGGAAGGMLGTVVGRKLVADLPSYFVSSFGVRIGFHVYPWIFPGTVLAGAVVAVLAALLASRRTLAVPPVEAARTTTGMETTGEHAGVRWGVGVVGLVMFTTGAVLLPLTGGVTSLVASFALLLGVVAAAYAFSSVVTAAVSGVGRALPRIGVLVAEGARRSPKRSWATVMAVFAAAATTVATGGLVKNIEQSVRSDVYAEGQTDLYVSPVRRQGFGVVLAFDDQVGKGLSHVPGVAHVAGTRRTFATLGKDRILLLGYEDGPPLVPLAHVNGSVRRLVAEGKATVISRQLATAKHLAVGDQFRLPTATGTHTLPVAAVVDSFYWARGLAVVSLGQLNGWFRTTGVNEYLLDIAAGNDVSVVRRQARLVAERISHGSAFTYTGQESLRLLLGETAQIGSVFQSMLVVISAAALLALVNSLLLSVGARRREIAMLRAIGLERGTAAKMVLGEALAVGIVGSTLGTAVGLVLHASQVPALRAFTNFPFHYSFLLGRTITAMVSAAVLATLAAVIPARRVSRLGIVGELSWE